MNRPALISVFSDQHRTKSTTWSRTSCATHTWVRAPQDFFLRRCGRPSVRPTPHPWSGSSSPGTRSVAVRLDGPGGPCPGRRQCRSRRTLFASGRTPWAVAPVHHTDQRPALYPTSAVSEWRPSLLRCSVFALFACVLSVILTEERLLQFQLRQDTATTGVLMIPGLNLSQLTNQRQVDVCKTARSAYLLVSWERSTTAISYSVMPMSRCTHSKALRRRLVMGTG